ncbi:MAG: carbamoyltransferase [Herbinix sp.]|jgi:carbamoyltransferase|nr:carbamoyltransferase [Herbinix sp.]
MLLLGVSGGHDANWCLFQDGKLIGAFEKERFSRNRHDSGYVMDLVQMSLKKQGFDLKDVEFIATSEHNHIGTEPGLELINQKCYTRPDEWVEQSVLLEGRKVPCISVPHHLCHASYAYYTSNHEDSAVLTWDGGGDFYTIDAYTSTSASLWKNGKLQWMERIGNCDIGSLWHIYSKVIFNNPFAAGKLMGLAALGQPDLLTSMSDYSIRPTRGILSNISGIKNCWPDEDLPPYNQVSGWEDKNAQNLAYAIQDITCTVGIDLADALYEISKVDHLALSGGVALNGYLNTEIVKRTKFRNVSVPPSVHDGGLSIGAAMFVLNHILGLKTETFTTNDLVFTGIEYQLSDYEEALNNDSIVYEKSNKEQNIKKAVDDITSGKIIAWYEGRSEHGPRALGHRSIIASPVFPDMKERLNNTIKFREPFRPIAPVVLEDDITFCTDDITTSPFMMFIVNTKEEFRKSCPSAIHIDGSARVQTVNRDNPMGLMLEELKHRGQIPVLLNTSFNVNSPIVETPFEAIDTFLRVPIDTLYLDNYVVKRRER